MTPESTRSVIRLAASRAGVSTRTSQARSTSSSATSAGESRSLRRLVLAARLTRRRPAGLRGTRPVRRLSRAGEPESTGRVRGRRCARLDQSPRLPSDLSGQPIGRWRGHAQPSGRTPPVEATADAAQIAIASQPGQRLRDSIRRVIIEGVGPPEAVAGGQHPLAHLGRNAGEAHSFRLSFLSVS